MDIFEVINQSPEFKKVMKEELRECIAGIEDLSLSIEDIQELRKPAKTFIIPASNEHTETL